MKTPCWKLVVMTVSVVDAGCTLVVTVVLGCLDEARALQQTTTTQMMMGRTIKSTIPATVPPAIPPTLPIQRDMIITQVKSHYSPKWISLASSPGLPCPFLLLQAIETRGGNSLETRLYIYLLVPPAILLHPVSSLPSVQSRTPSQRSENLIHVPLLHRNAPL